MPAAIDLDSHWLPLKQIQNDPNVGQGMFATMDGQNVRGDLGWFLNANEVDQNSILEHEHVHAMHEAQGLADFLRRYQSDPYFRLAEEKEAFTVQIHYLLAHGASIDVEAVVRYFRAKDLPMMDQDVRNWVASIR